MMYIYKFLILFLIIVDSVNTYGESDSSYHPSESTWPRLSKRMKSTRTAISSSNQRMDSTAQKTTSRAPWTFDVKRRRTNKVMMAKKINELLETQGNGVKTYDQAKEMAHEHFDQVRLERNRKDRERYAVKPVRKRKVRPKGYQSTAQTHERNIKSYMGKDPNLTKEQATEMSKNRLIELSKRRTLLHKQQRAKKRMLRLQKVSQQHDDQESSHTHIKQTTSPSSVSPTKDFLSQIERGTSPHNPSAQHTQPTLASPVEQPSLNLHLGTGSTL